MLKDGLNLAEDLKSIFYEDEKKILKTIDKFQHCDYDLIRLNADERTVSHQIACYLKPIFSNFNVDCEYNRINYNIKKRSIQQKDLIIRPDIIIHKRGTSDNHIAIEIKKGNRSI